MTTGDCFGYLAGCVSNLSPARFAGELYSAIYDGFYPHVLMVAGYYAFVVLALALAFRLTGTATSPAKTAPLRAGAGRHAPQRLICYLLIFGILIGLILESGGFGGGANFGAYAGF